MVPLARRYATISTVAFIPQGSGPLHERLGEPDLVNLKAEFDKRESKPRLFLSISDPNIAELEAWPEKLGDGQSIESFTNRFRTPCMGTESAEIA